MAEVRDLELWSRDRRLGLLLSRTMLSDLLQFCRQAGHRETGGILIGRYTDSLDLAIVHQVTGPPRDSTAGRAWFRRGIAGLQNLLLDRWRKAHDYYLGEWHLHPGSPPNPSSDDVAQMKRICETPEYQCPEPILLIVGGDPQGEWTISAHVYPRGEPSQQMTEIRPTKSARPVS